MWSAFEVVESLESTNLTMAQRARDGAAHGSVLVAEEQTAGRGRRERGWTAPRHSSVMLSVLVRPDVSAARWGWIPLLTGLAVVDAVETLGVSATLKWPNDVLVGDRKLSGVLCEVVPTSRGNAVVAGWGINVDQGESELPGDTATSVRLSGGRVDRADLLVGVLSAWESWYDAWASDASRVRSTYEQRSSTLGRDVRAQLPDGSQLEGRAVRLGDGGELVVLVNGQEREVASADVVHVRAASG
jgi:BirA family biotin operon repressor/biotin-[acetyl-CoA-carboxylase] ligase